MGVLMLLFYTDIILSLTRTSRVGYLRDIRRLTVALSRARLGLYILGRRQVFESCYELREAFELLLKRPDKLTLVTGELWPTERLLLNTDAPAGEEDGSKEADGEAKGREQEVVSTAVATVPGEAIMEGVEHLGQYVYEMTNTRIKQLRDERAGLPAVSQAVPAADESLVEDVAVDGGEEGEEDDAQGVEEDDTEEGIRAEGFEAEED